MSHVHKCGGGHESPAVRTTDAIATLTRFSRTLSTATDPAEMLQLLARASVEQLGGTGAVVLQVGEEGIARVAAHADISFPDDFSANVDEIGPELGWRLIEAAGEPFEQAHTFPLVSDGDLFGALVVLFKEGTLAEMDLHLAAGLVDLAAAMLGKAHQYIGLNRAHAELKVAHEALARTEKLRALGEMAAGISHDLKNILAPMSMQVDRLERAPQDVERVKRVAQSLKRVVKRGVDTVERLVAFSRRSPAKGAAELVDVNALMTEAIDLVRHRPGFLGATVQIDLGHPPQVMLVSSELVTALVNIIVNAFEALPSKGGSVAFRTGASAHGAWMQVQDTGSGIPDEVRRRLFEPFFTTKGMNGTGLGLSMVYAFVQRYAGHIDVQSASGQGTTITLTFPSAPEQHEHPGAPAPTGAR
jgi:signal transduction histidine kinase